MTKTHKIMNILKNITPYVIALCFSFSTLFINAQDRKMGVVDDAVKMIVKRVDGLEEYSSTIDFNDNRKQLLMAGQNYQTNYGIYASIKMGESSLGSNYKTLKNVEFEIVNYKPTYFIGIDSIVVAESRMKNGLTFKIYTRALSDTNTYTLNETTLKNIHFENGSYLHSERYLNPMFPKKDSAGNVIFDSDGRVSCEPDNRKAFDFEFFYKDGRHIVRKEDYDQEKENPQTYMNEIASTLPGKRCFHSFNKVMF
ncbi:hypothetical protein CLV90_0556 [Maribacter spongiicola]|uniref:Uncharacterized protein n=2 Tax=Maribacter spongiicola TaxID=1206753 RepID=A0A4V3ERT3_9FLAO|nr:hypothetical protein CLV90_0556 [Maribacter spongiicola]